MDLKLIFCQMFNIMSLKIKKKKEEEEKKMCKLLDILKEEWKLFYFV